jgi:hypothetical protein
MTDLGPPVQSQEFSFFLQNQDDRMRHNFTILASAFFSLAAIVVLESQVNAEEYVWARTNWGASNVSRPYSSMSNGYGGYYVPKNGYGNNYEGRKFTNPDGFVIPAQPSRSNNRIASRPKWLHF